MRLKAKRADATGGSDSVTATESHPTVEQLLAIGAMCAVVVAACLLRFPSLFEPRWYGDEGIFAAVATDVRAGQSLYSDAWDNKPPLIFVTYASVQALFGTGVGALHAVASMAVIATLIVVMAIASLLYGGTWRAAVAGVIFALVTCTPIIEGNLAMTETFMMLPASLAMLVYVLGQRRPAMSRLPWYAGAGLLFGIAAGYKQVAVFEMAAVAVLVLANERQPLRTLIALGGGFALPEAATALYFAATGTFGDYWYAIAGSLGLYNELGPERDPLTRAAGFLPALLATAWIVRRVQVGERVTAQSLPVVWLGFAIAGATSSSFAFPHYLLQATAPFALTIVAMPLEYEHERLARWTLAVSAVLAVAVVAGHFSIAYEERRQIDPIDYYRTFLSHEYGTMSDLDYEYYFDGKAVAVRDIAAYIEQDGAAPRTLYTWSELPWLHAATGNTNPTRYYTSFLGELVPDAKPEIIASLEAEPPAYIVISDDTFAPFPELDAFVRDDYVVLRAQNDWRLYRRADLDGTLEPASSP